MNFSVGQPCFRLLISIEYLYFLNLLAHQNQSPNSPQSRFSTDRLKNLLSNAQNPESKLNIMESYSIGLENSIYRFHNAARRRNFFGRIILASGLLYISYFLYETVTSAVGPSTPSSSQNSGFRRTIFSGNGANDNVRMEVILGLNFFRNFDFIFTGLLCLAECIIVVRVKFKNVVHRITEAKLKNSCHIASDMSIDDLREWGQCFKQNRVFYFWNQVESNY